MSPKIGIVTVLYRSETVLEEFFISLNKQSYKNFVLYVIDNKSPDNSLDLSKKMANSCSFESIIIENDDNYGIAKGNNIGIRKALDDACDLILLSNNDVVFSENTIALLLQGMQEEKADLVVPKIYFYDTNLLWLGGGLFKKYNGWSYHTAYMQEDKGQCNQRKAIGYAPTCFMLIHKELFDKVGLMDENYFVYWDDTDFVYRALKQKMVLYYIPESTVYHKESTSTGKESDFSVRYKYRNFIYFVCKNYNFGYAFYVILFNLSVHLFKRFFTMKKKQWALALKSYLEGFILYLKRNK